MLVLKAIVNKLPDGCEKCSFMIKSWAETDEEEWTDKQYSCQLAKKQIHHLDRRPEWCPLSSLSEVEEIIFDHGVGGFSFWATREK